MDRWERQHGQVGETAWTGSIDIRQTGEEGTGLPKGLQSCKRAGTGRLYSTFRQDWLNIPCFFLKKKSKLNAGQKNIVVNAV
jgi:hypothetical protein